MDLDSSLKNRSSERRRRPGVRELAPALAGRKLASGQRVGYPELLRQQSGTKVPHSKALCTWLLALTLWGLAPAYAQSTPATPSGTRPQLLRDVGIDQKLNEQVPLDLPFRDETGKSVRLRDYFGEKPVVLTLVYYECPMLCTQVLNGLLRSLQNLNLDAGRQFAVLAVSFNPRETPELALAKQKMYTGIYGRPGASAGWHFLTGEQPAIQQLAKSVGFRYAYDPVSGQYAHATAVMVLTPEGKISRYFYGIEYPSRDLRLGLVEASAGRIGSPADQVLLFCYHYDPTTGKYGLVISNIVRAAGLATALALGIFMFVMFRREQFEGGSRQ